MTHADELRTIEGWARDAKGGALVLCDDGSTLYVAHLTAWPSELHGRRVIVEGTIASEQYIPEAQIDAKGAISQGAVGRQQVIHATRWALAPEPGA